MSAVDVDELTTSDLFAILRARAATVPAGLIDWIAGAGVNLVRIAVCFGGFDAREVVRALAREKPRGVRINAATVGRVLAGVSNAHEARR